MKNDIINDYRIYAQVAGDSDLVVTIWDWGNLSFHPDQSIN